MTRTPMTTTARRPLRAGLLAGAALAAALVLAPPAPAAESPGWRPQSSERLIRLPASSLEKRIDLDFSESSLAAAIRQTETEIAYKTQTLSDLQSAIGLAERELRVELRHQFLAEKRAYVELMARKIDLELEHLGTRERLYEDMLGRLTRNGAATSPARLELIRQQEGARTRFESALAQVDMAVFGTAAAPQSRYAQDYTQNMAAIEQLIGRVQSHSMTPGIDTGMGEVTQQDYVRQLLTETQARIAIVDQENSIIGYMAKLVALDAQALAEEGMDAELLDSDIPGGTSPAGSVQFFMTN